MGRVRIQLHDGLTIWTEGIRVVEGRSKLSLIIGSDLLGTRGAELRKVGASMLGGEESITVEVGAYDSGELFRLPLYELGREPGGPMANSV